MAFIAANFAVLSLDGKRTLNTVIKLEVLSSKACLLVAVLAPSITELTVVGILVAAFTGRAFWLPPPPAMAFCALLSCMLATERPARGSVVKDFYVLHIPGDVTVFAETTAKDPFRMWVLMARRAT